MSKYTTEVRFICENAAGLKDSAGYSEVNNIIQAAIPKVFSFGFPIFDEAYRNVLCTKILKHYYTREIAAESVGLWKLWLDTRLNEIMPYYNKLYESELLEFNPLYDTSITTENNGTKNETTTSKSKDVGSKTGTGEHSKGISSSGNSQGENTGKSSETTAGTNDGTNWDVYSDTPQGALDNVANETYLTNARKVTDNKTDSRNTSGTSEGNSSATFEENTTETGDNAYSENNTIDRSGNTSLNSTDAYVQTVVGKSGGQSYSKMLEDFRKTFLNIDMLVISALNDLFFQLW